MTIAYRYTRHQVPRGTRPDGEQGNSYYLFKNVSKLTATYQVRLLAYRASEEGKKLIIRVPKVCELQPALKRLTKDMAGTIVVEKI